MSDPNYASAAINGSFYPPSDGAALPREGYDAGLNRRPLSSETNSTEPMPCAVVGGFTGDASNSPPFSANLAYVERSLGLDPSFYGQSTVPSYFHDPSSLNTSHPRFNDALSPWPYPTENPEVQQQQQQQIWTTPSLTDEDAQLNDEISGPTAVVGANALDGQPGFEALYEQQALLENGPPVLQPLHYDRLNGEDSIASQLNMGDGTIPNENATTFMETTTDLQPYIVQSNDAMQKKTRITAMSKGREKKTANSLSTCLPSSSGAKALSTTPNAIASRKSRAKRIAKAKQTKIDLKEANKKLKQKDKKLEEKDRELQQKDRELGQTKNELNQKTNELDQTKKTMEQMEKRMELMELREKKTNELESAYQVVCAENMRLKAFSNQ
uniref:BZIP domain-containing protein n=1 Tax=Plectus sambesii TaxID=2011161 RepID=A0A914XMX2_9BILA